MGQDVRDNKNMCELTLHVHIQFSMSRAKQQCFRVLLCLRQLKDNEKVCSSALRCDEINGEKAEGVRGNKLNGRTGKNKRKVGKSRLRERTTCLAAVVHTVLMMNLSGVKDNRVV